MSANKITVASTASVKGNLSYKRVAIDDGAVLDVIFKKFNWLQMSSTITRILFYIILSALILQTTSKGFSDDNFPKVLSCVKGKSDDFTLHLVT